MQDFYQILGVSKTATQEEIQSAYRKLAKQFHPYRHLNEGDEAVAEFAHRMGLISQAYEVLSNTAARNRYDQLGGSASTASSNPDFNIRGPNESECLFCAHTPATTATIRQNVGMIIFRRHATFSITACRGCGLALAREMQNRTLIVGWWGLISFFANFVAMVGNAFAIVKFGRLDDPSPPLERIARPQSEPSYQGKSVFRRLGVYVAAVVIGFGIFGAINHNSTNVAGNNNWAVGECVSSSGKYITGVVSCSGQNFGQIVGMVSDSQNCPDATTNYFTEQSTEPNPGQVVCIRGQG